MRQERFTEQAQEALALSQQLVASYQHSQWDVEHILLALLQQEKGLVVDILQPTGQLTPSIEILVFAATILLIFNFMDKKLFAKKAL